MSAEKNIFCHIHPWFWNMLLWGLRTPPRTTVRWSLRHPTLRDGSDEQYLVPLSAFKYQYQSHQPLHCPHSRRELSAVMVKLAFQSRNQLCFPLITILYKSLASISLQINSWTTKQDSSPMGGFSGHDPPCTRVFWRNSKDEEPRVVR